MITVNDVSLALYDIREGKYEIDLHYPNVQDVEDSDYAYALLQLRIALADNFLQHDSMKFSGIIFDLAFEMAEKLIAYKDQESLDEDGMLPDMYSRYSQEVVYEQYELLVTRLINPILNLKS